jgi:hypothetical protein
VPAIALLVVHAISDTKWFSRRLAAWSLVGGGCVYLGAAIFSRFGNHWIHSSHSFSWEMTVLLFATCGAFSWATLFAGFSFFFPFYSVKHFSLGAASVLAIALLMEMVPSVIKRTNLDLLSGKALALAFHADARASLPLRLFGFRRDYHYALNFYLHEEVPDWVDDPIRNGYVLSKDSNCAQLKTADQCTDLWAIYDRNVNWGLLKITPNDSPAGLGGRREPK